MNLMHVVPHINREASGPSYSVPRLCQSLATLGNNVELSCLAASGEVQGVSLDVHPQWPKTGRFAVSSSLAWALCRKAKLVDVIHNHSLWSMVNVAAGWMVPGKRAKLVVSPRGTLSTWALGRSRTVKRLIWPLQRRALARADLIHATSFTELREIRALGFDTPVAMIPNGIDLPVMPAKEPRADTETRTLLYLGRIHPIKGLDRLLLAWCELQSRHPNWRLVIAGTGEAMHIQKIRSLAINLGVARVEFAGPIFGGAKSEAYFAADLFVLPTHSENFGMVVAEALAHSCPAVVSRGAPWPGLVTEGCGWWVDNNVVSLAAALDTAMMLSSDQLDVMGSRGRDWMERDFSWPSIGEKMDAAYRWLLAGKSASTKPDWVTIE